MRWTLLSCRGRRLVRVLISLVISATTISAFADASQPVTSGSTSTGSAQSATGDGGVVQRPGFGCPSGYTWNSSSPWLGCQPPPANCSATTVSSGGCTYNIPFTVSGSSVSVSPSGAGYTGNYSATCNNGGWVGATASCTPPPCASGPATSGACSYSLPATASGGSQTVSTSTAGYSGSLTASCTAGAWSSSGATCSANPCGANTATSGACSFALPDTASGGSSTVSTSTAGYTGSLTASCTAGAWSSSGATCSANACGATTANWSVGANSCAGPLAAAASGGSVTVTDSGGNGHATYSCSAGAWGAPSSATCAAALPASPLPPTAGTPGTFGYFSPRIGGAGQQLFQILSNGTWSVSRSGFPAAGLMTTGSPTSGTWTSDSSQVYEYTVTQAVSLVGNPGTVSPTTTTTTWTTLSSLSFIAKTPGGGTPEGDGRWTINIRKKGTTIPVLTITVELDTANGD